MRNTIVLVLFLFSRCLVGETLIRSDTAQANLIELYTSEGCSSCPPADRWLSTLVEHPALWQQLIPVAFHVDYWDYIGWKDRFARPEFTVRQRRYANESGLSTIYTPGVLSNGKEWRNFGWKAQPASAGHNVGPLSAKIGTDELTMSFEPAQTLAGDRLVVNIVLLGFGLTSEVRAGENRGRKLAHDFVVLAYERAAMNFRNGFYEVTTQRPRSAVDAKRYAMALWVSTEHEQTPLQAAGGWLDP